MATDQINSQDQYAKQRQQNQPKFDAFGGLQKTFQQEGSQVGGLQAAPGFATQGLQGNVANTQNQASQNTVKAGTGLNTAAADSMKKLAGSFGTFTPTTFSTTATTNHLDAPLRSDATYLPGPGEATAVPAPAPSNALQSSTDASFRGIGDAINGAINQATAPTSFNAMGNETGGSLTSQMKPTTLNLPSAPQTVGTTAANIAKAAGGLTQAAAAATTPGPGTDQYAQTQILSDNAKVAALNQDAADINNRLKAAQAGAKQQTDDFTNQDTATRLANEATALKNTDLLNTGLRDMNATLNAAPSGDKLSSIGQQNALENRSAGQNQVLGSPTASNISKLTAMFNPGYNSSRYGGLDAGLYNQQINDASQKANALNQQSASAEAQKEAAINSYITNQKATAKNIADYGETEGKTLTGSKGTIDANGNLVGASGSLGAGEAEELAYKKALKGIVSEDDLMSRYNTLMDTNKSGLKTTSDDLAAQNLTLNTNKQARDQVERDRAAREKDTADANGSNGYLSKIKSEGKQFLNSGSVGDYLKNATSFGAEASGLPSVGRWFSKK